MAKQIKELPADLDDLLTVRVNSERLSTLKKKALAEGRPHTFVIREMMDAYNEGRMTISKPK